MKTLHRCLTMILALLAGTAHADDFADAAGVRYRVKADQVYRTASGQALKLDLYLQRAPAAAPAPVLVYFHGGGWVDGRKENAAFMLLPYLALGWTVVNVEYRLAGVAPAPAAVEDARCALRWVKAHASEHGFDAGTMVVAGDSAGGHLALAGAMLPAGSPFDRACPTADNQRWSGGAEQPLAIAAVINWYGIADVEALLEGPARRHYAIEWFGADGNRLALARQLSPLRLVRPDAPPVISVHGSADPVVPYAQARALHVALDRAGVPNRLLTIDGGNHGAFTAAQAQQANAAIRQFLREQGVGGRP